MQKLYFAHISKTSGTTISKLIENFFDHKNIYPGRDNHHIYIYKNYNNYKFFTGHFVLPKSLNENNFRCITMLREPYERFNSHLRHVEKFKTRIDTRNNILSRFIVRNNIFKNILTNRQVKIIKKKKFINIKEFKKIYTITKKYFLIGFTEKIEETYLLLCYFYNKRPTDNIYKENISDNKNQKKLNKNKFKLKHRLDYILYNILLRRFSNTIKAVIKKEIENLKKNHQVLNKFFLLLKSFGNTNIIKHINLEDLKEEDLKEKETLYYLAFNNYFIKPNYKIFDHKEKNFIIYASDSLSETGWHRREYDYGNNNLLAYKWSGPGFYSDIHIPINSFEIYKHKLINLKIYLHNYNSIIYPKQIIILVNGFQLDTNYIENEKMIFCSGTLKKIPFLFLILSFKVNHVQMLSKFLNNDDRRSVGFAYNQINISLSS
jgi:hypothetical protein